MSDGSELPDVKRIGPPLPRVTVQCRACGGTGYCDSGFSGLSNTSTGSRCSACAGAGRVWRDVFPPAIVK